MPSSRGLRRGAAALAALIWLSGIPDQAFAQKDSPDIPVVSNVTAIQNARIVQAPGQVIESGTVVFRNGVITAVGRRAEIPYDAHIIDGGDSLTVYAGFIDVLSHAGVEEKDEDNPSGAVDDRSNPGFDRAGITPQKDVRAALDPSDSSVNNHRRRGFTTTLAAPHGRMLPGQTSIIQLTGEQPTDMVLPGLRPVLFEFQGAQGVYPGEPMAIMSQFRQIYRESERRMAVQAMYEDDPNGMSRPAWDDVHAAFVPIIDGSTPLIAFTKDALEIHRVLSLSEQLGFSPILAGLTQAYDVLDELQESGLSMVLTLDVPDRPEWAASIERDSVEQVLSAFNDETRTATFRDVEAEKRNLEAKQLIARRQYTGMPARFAEAGIPFAFSTYGMASNEVRRNLIEYVADGLSEDAALAALTANAASILGIDEIMGSIENGKMANLLVTDGNYFDKDSDVLMLFIEGKLHLVDDCPRGDRSCPDSFSWDN